MRTFRRFIIGTAATLFTLPTVAAAQCDCNHFPWEPESCVDICGARLFNQTNAAEITTFLSLKPATVDKILELRGRVSGGKFDSLKEVKNGLPADEYESVVRSLERLDPFVGRYLLLSPDARNRFHEMAMDAPPYQGPPGM